MRTVRAITTAAIAIAVLAVATSAQAAPAQSSTAAWRVVYRTQEATPGPLSSVTAPAREDAWAVGSSGTANAAVPLILHWDGANWQPASIPGPAAFAPRLVTSTSPDDVWILGAEGKQSLAWIYDGATWHSTVLPGPFQDGAFGAVSGSDAWGSAYAVCVSVGIGSQPPSTSCTSTISHWNGARWSAHGLNGFLESIVVAGGHAWFLDLTSIQGVTTNHPTGLPVIYEATGTTLKKVSTVAATRIVAGAALAASPSGQLWVLAHQGTAKRPAVLLHWTGHRWTRIAVPARAGGRPLVTAESLAYDGGSGVWAGPFAHWTGRQWVNTDPGRLTGASRYSLTAMALIPGTASIWAVGWVARTPADETHDTLIASYGPAF